MRRAVAGVLVFLGATTLLPACAGDDAAKGMTVQTEEMEFLPKNITLPAGRHVIAVQNTGEIRHTFSVNALGEEVTVAPGQTRSITLDLEPGTYRYVCRILDHEGLGMRGALKIRSNG